MASDRPIALDTPMPRRAAPIVVAWQAAPRVEKRAPVTHRHATLAFFTDGHARMEQHVQWPVAAGDVLLIPSHR